MGAVMKQGNFTRLFTFLLLVLLLLALLGQALAAEEQTQRIVVNDEDWRALYLVSAYAHFLELDAVFFTSLTDAQLKTKMLGQEEEIMVFESTNDPIVKNYASFLRVNGYENFDSFTYDSLEELQEYLEKQIEATGYFVITSEFGLDAVTGAPLVSEKNYFPLFLTKDSLKFIESKTKQKNSYIVGRAPVRMLEKLDGTKIQGYPQDTMQETSQLVMQELNDPEWGLIMRIDTIDIPALWQGLPIFVFYADEYLDELTTSVKDSGIVKFEVIGGGTADIAKAIELKSQKNLNFMLKYGRKVTNYPGLEDRILDIDSIPFNYPQERLEIIATNYYESLNTLAVTFENQGNVDVLFFSNIEMAGQPLSDENTHAIAAGETKTIPFKLDEVPDDLDVIVTTRYGASLPLKFAVSGEAGTLYYSATAETGPYAEEQTLQIVNSGFDTQEGYFEVIVKNPYDVPIKIFAELLISDQDVISSSVLELQPKEKGLLILDAAYIPNDAVLGKELDLITYVGTQDTLVKTTTPTTIKKKTTSGILGFVLGGEASTAMQIVSVVVLVLIILLLYFLFFVMRRRRKKDKEGPKKTFVPVTKTKKQTAKKKRASKKKTISQKKGRSHMKK